MTRRALPAPTRLPGITAVSQRSLVEAVDQLKKIVEVREGRAGTDLDKAVTVRDLFQSGLVRVMVNGRVYTKPSNPGEVLSNPIVPFSREDIDRIVSQTPGGGYVAPTNLTALSGTNELLIQGDGTIVNRIRFSWTPINDETIAGYEVQFKRTTDAVWLDAPFVQGFASSSTWITDVLDGVTYNLRVRAVDALGGAGTYGSMTHTVSGKTVLPANVTGFSASQNSNVVIFQWNQVSDVDLAGYEIRYGVLGSTWANGTPLTRVTRGTQITSAAVPPGVWKMMIKARDTSGNYSATEDTTNITVTNTYDVIDQKQQAPDWIGTKTGLVITVSGSLIPDSTLAANAHTNVELFETFVPYPVAQGIYEAPEMDVGFDDNCRIWGSIDSVLGRGVTVGIADPKLEVDFRTQAGAYDGFEPWTIGDRLGRYFKHRFILTTAQGKARIDGFLPTVDLSEETQSVRGASVSAGGQILTFPSVFHRTPNVVAVYAGSGARFVTVTNITTTGFTCNVFDTAGTNVGGTVNYDATGV